MICQKNIYFAQKTVDCQRSFSALFLIFGRNIEKEKKKTEMKLTKSKNMEKISPNSFGLINQNFSTNEFIIYIFFNFYFFRKHVSKLNMGNKIVPIKGAMPKSKPRSIWHPISSMIYKDIFLFLKIKITTKPNHLKFWTIGLIQVLNRFNYDSSTI